MLRYICFLCVLLMLLGAVTVSAQYNPYGKDTKPAEQTAKVKSIETDATTVNRKKRAPVKKQPVKKSVPERRTPITSEATPVDAATASGESPLSGRIDALENNLEAMRLMLARAGIHEDVNTLPYAAREKYGQLETRLQKLRADHKALVAAIDRGLAPELVMTNLQALETQMSDVQKEMDTIRMQTDGQGGTMSAQMKTNEARISQLEDEVASLKKCASTTDDHSAPVKEVADAKVAPSVMDKLNALLPVEIFAFGDFMYVIQEDAPDDFAIGQLELDLTQDLIEQVTITAAIAYDSEVESIGVGAFTIDGRLLGSDESHLLLSKKIDSFGVILGQFDVPFGIDYLSYASIDRRLVTGPIAVDATHGGWNDLGIQLYLMAPKLNAVLYGVNGYGYETALADAAGNEVVFAHPTAMALGGRLGVLPVDEVEIGGSLATFFNADAEVAQLLAGADAAVHVNDFVLNGEYIYQTQGVESESDTRTQAFYGGALYDFKPVFVTGRYSMVWPEDEDSEKQLSLGMGVQVFENGEIRFEYSTSLETGGSMAFIQLAGGSAWQPSGMRR